MLGVMDAPPLKNMDIVEEIVKYRLKTEMQMFIFPTLYISTSYTQCSHQPTINAFSSWPVICCNAWIIYDLVLIFNPIEFYSSI